MVIIRHNLLEKEILRKEFLNKGEVEYGIEYYSCNSCTCRHNPWDSKETQDFGNSISNCIDYHCNYHVIFLQKPLLKF